MALNKKLPMSDRINTNTYIITFTYLYKIKSVYKTIINLVHTFYFI